MIILQALLLSMLLVAVQPEEEEPEPGGENEADSQADENAGGDPNGENEKDEVTAAPHGAAPAPKPGDTSKTTSADEDNGTEAVQTSMFSIFLTSTMALLALQL